MLRTSQSRKQVAQPFVCFQCLARYQRSPSNTTISRRPQLRSQSKALENGKSKEIRRQFHAGHVSRSSLEAQTAAPLPQEPPPLPSKIRERLRQWQKENAASIPENPGLVIDKAPPGEVGNDVLSASYNYFGGEEAAPREESSGLDFERFDMVDVGDSRNFFLPGDLVELSSVGNRRQEIAIYVRELGGQAQFYTMTGRWIHRAPMRITFFVPGFVDSQELDEIRPFLPQEAVDLSMEGKLQSFNESVPINFAQPLVRKMNDFWNKADSIYQEAAMSLDDAHQSMADIFQFKYCTLEEIAGQVLPKSIPKNENGKHEWTALYAVHRAILKDNIGFTPSSLAASRANPQYEINARCEIDGLRRVVRWVRDYTDYLLGHGEASRVSRASRASRASSNGNFQFVEFAKRARRLIDQSRSNRQYTTSGTIGPSLTTLEPGQNFRSGTPREAFDASDMYFIRFLESWACLRSFGPNSTLHGIGSAILRLIDRYEDEELNTKTAWTCLQELGALPPWENISTFQLRLPHVGRQDTIARRLQPPSSVAGGVVKDKLSAIRKSWGDTAIYCVDDAGALEIDDGFSIEATDVPGVYWVHVHVADPAAHLDPRGLMSHFAERLTETIYLPDRVVPMLPLLYTKKHYSLAPGRPCLTFSTKTNLQGNLLEGKITAGIVKNVKYLTKETFREMTVGSSSVEYDFYVVGTPQPRPTSTRPLLKSDQFSEEEKANMKILQAIGGARRGQLRARGGISGGYPSPLVSMSFNGVPWTKPKTVTDSLQFFGDPTISIGIERSVAEGLQEHQQMDTVADLMIMTGEMAARWCNERNIPIPYRVTPLNPDKQDPSEYFHETVRPSQDENGNVTAEIMREYFRLIGRVQPSSIPGPHVALGVDMLAKVTSPLRRFGDLVAHWQIEAAILQEASSGQSLVGKSNAGYLPFSRAELDEMLPRMANRERMISTHTRNAERLTLLRMVLRAWKFGEAKLPSSLEFTVRDIKPDTGIVSGMIKKLLLDGQMIVPPWMKPEDIKMGDRFEVEIEDIDIYWNRARFAFVRPLESESELAARKEETQSVALEE